jgi:D-amino peptidase
MIKKFYISADMEGIAGLAAYRHGGPASPDFRWMVELWTRQINFIVEAAFDAGMNEVLINEAHSGMNYLNLSQLDPRAGLVSGYVKTDNQMHGLNKEFLGGVFIGHARAGTECAVLNHTYVMRDVVEVRLSGNPIGELGLNGIWASYLGSGLIMVVGDDQTAEEARQFDPQVETAVLKEGLSQFSARHLSLKEVEEVLKTTTRKAIKRRLAGEIPNFPLPDHFEMEIDFSISEIAHLCSFIPSVKRVGARTVRFGSTDYREVQHLRIVCTNLALAVRQSHFQ